MTSLSLARCPSPPPLYHSPLSAHYLSPSSHLLRGVPVAARRRTSPVALSDGRVLLAGDRRRFFFFLWLSSFPPSSLFSACSSSFSFYSFAFLYPLLLFIISLLYASLASSTSSFIHFFLLPYLHPLTSSSSILHLFLIHPPLPSSSSSSSPVRSPSPDLHVILILLLHTWSPQRLARGARRPHGDCGGRAKEGERWGR